MRFAPQENSILKGKKHKRLCEECTARRASSLKKKERKKETEKSGAHDVRAWLQLTTHHTKEPLNLMTCMHVLPGSEVRTPCPFGHGTQKGSCKYAVRKNRSIQDPDRFVGSPRMVVQLHYRFNVTPSPREKQTIF